MKLNDGKYAVFLDIDGTVMGKSQEALQRNFDVIQKVRSLGHKVYINTGRSTVNVPSRLNICKYFDGVISGAGARIVMEGKEVYCKPVDFQSVNRFCECCFEKGYSCFLEGIDNMFYISKADDDKGWPKITEEDWKKYVTKEFLVEKFSISGTVANDIGEAMGENFTIMQHKDYAEVTQTGITKSMAMKRVLNILEFPEENSIAMGDSLNDFDMIEKAGISVAMGNAVPEIKNIATMITSDVNNAGVAEALEKIFNL